MNTYIVEMKDINHGKITLPGLEGGHKVILENWNPLTRTLVIRLPGSMYHSNIGTRKYGKTVRLIVKVDEQPIKNESSIFNTWVLTEYPTKP